MSGASPSRAAVFTSAPQSVEIYERGAWWPGSMLGWRHDSSGTCQAWVRVEFAGVVEDAWVELTLLRLPQSGADRHLALAREPRGASGGRRGVVRPQPVVEGPEITQTQHFPLVRDGGASSAGGRRRAPETAEHASLAAPRSRPRGRHRAPAAADSGRHRAADTGILAAVATATASVPAVDHSAPPPPREELPPAGPVVRPVSARPQSDGDLLTRPMRLEEGVGGPRRIRRDSLTGV